MRDHVLHGLVTGLIAFAVFLILRLDGSLAAALVGALSAVLASVLVRIARMIVRK